jgi:AAA family ATP:ADP antiporter
MRAFARREALMPGVANALPGDDRKSWLDRTLSIFAEVRQDESTTVLLLAANGFLILAAYDVIRPLRSALVLPIRIGLPGGGVLTGPEIQSYVGAIMAPLFLVIVPLYGIFASTVNRIRLINYVTLFFGSNLLVFFLLGRAELMPTISGLSSCGLCWR